MTKADKIAAFDPNGVCLSNGNFAGLPFDEDDAEVVLFPVPWEVTVSYSAGCAEGPENIREASLQLDLYDPDVTDAWKLGIFMQPTHQTWWERSDEMREHAETVIKTLEEGGDIATHTPARHALRKVNAATSDFVKWVQGETKSLLKRGKLVGLIGGDHSSPLGYLAALAETHSDGFGILQIDAHCDLREAYEGFTHSHASIFYNALELAPIQKLVQVGIRDYCADEVALIDRTNGRVTTFFDQDLKERVYEGETWAKICEEIVAALPTKVYVSFDIDGLDPKLCPNTGTPVAGGFELNEVFYLLKKLLVSGRTIIGFDVCETNGEYEWDGNVGARMVYKLCNLMGKSNHRI